MEANPRYAFDQFARAYVTATTHEDTATRERALARMDRWAQVARGMASGKLAIGSRTPVDDLPVWVSPEVVRGGFATGNPAAGGSLREHERIAAEHAGVPASRAALFQYLMTPAGLDMLWEMVQRRDFDIELPEDAALLTVAWLVAQGDIDAAVALAQDLSAAADRVRLLTPSSDGVPADPSVIFRDSVGTAAAALGRYRDPVQIRAMREAFTVWSPLADDLLTLWLGTCDDTGRVDAARPEGWSADAEALLERHVALVSVHRLVRRHAGRSSNLSILLRATRTALGADATDPVPTRLLQYVVDAMVTKRGRPGSPQHTALRREQAAVAALPSHEQLARIAVARLADHPPSRGLRSVAPVLAAVTDAESAGSGIPVGTPLPWAATSILARTREGTPEELVAAGVISSAEVLAELVPPIAGEAVAARYPDPALRAIVAANYTAFRRRRGLLLLNLEHQVRVEELPWVSAVAKYQDPGQRTLESARVAVVRLAGLALGAFPGTILPSPLVTELEALARESGLRLPFVEELAADIFMGTFTPKFADAAHHADDLLRGSLYARYYGLEHTALPPRSPRGRSEQDAAMRQFAALCRDRAGAPADRWHSTAVNGTIIEQSQILTTHNLAVLTGPFGVGESLSLDWSTLADGCLTTVLTLAGRLDANPRPLRTVKDIAYAWRQMIFFLARLPVTVQRAFAATATAHLDAAKSSVRARLRPAVSGLSAVVDGTAFDTAGCIGDGRQLLGWSASRHWMLEPRLPDDERPAEAVRFSV